MKRRGKITKHRILALFSFSTSDGLSKNDMVRMYMEKFGISIKETAIYQILEVLTHADHFIRCERALVNNLSRRLHNKYFITPEGIDELVKLNATFGELKCRSLDSSPIDVPGGKRSVADFLRGPLLSPLSDQET